MDVIIWIKCMGKWMTCCIKKLHKGKMIEKKIAEKGEKREKLFNLWAIHQCLKIRCKMKWIF